MSNEDVTRTKAPSVLRRAALLLRGFSLRGVCNKAIRPAQLLRAGEEALIPAALCFTALFFGGYYLLTAMDWKHAGLISAGRMWAFFPLGLLTGAVAALALYGLLACFSRFSDDPHAPFAFAVPVAAATLLPAFLLLIALLIGWITSAPVSLSLGLTALLWWLFQILELMRCLFRKKILPVLASLTVYGFLLFCWLTFTFRFK